MKMRTALKKKDILHNQVSYTFIFSLTCTLYILHFICYLFHLIFLCAYMLLYSHLLSWSLVYMLLVHMHLYTCSDYYSPPSFPSQEYGSHFNISLIILSVLLPKSSWGSFFSNSKATTLVQALTFFLASTI